MTIRSVAFVIATACSGTQVVAPSPPPPSPSPAVGPADAQVAVVDAAASPPPAKAFARIEAPPAGSLRLVAATADGTAAVTGDELGGVRLWPALDGTAEPVIVDLPQPSALAMSRAGDAFRIAMIDDAGEAIVAAVDRDGQVVHHAAIAGTFSGIVAADDRFVAWGERSLVVADGDGAVVGTLAGAVAVASSAGRAAAVDKRRARWLDVKTPAWGDAIAGTDGFASIALASDRIAGTAGGRAVVVDLATGKQLASAPAPANAVLGFAGDRFAIVTPGSLAWLGGSKLARGKDPAVLAVGGNRAITVRGGDLALATPAGVQYLGYGLVDARVEPAGGKLLVGNGDRWAYVDASLDVVGTPKLSPGLTVETLVKLAGDDWLLVTQGATHDIYVANLATGALAKVHSRKHTTFVEAAAGLVAFGDGSLDDSELFRYAGGTLARVPLPKDTGLGMLYPVDPKLAHGVQLVRVSYAFDSDAGHLRWIRDLDHPDTGAIDLDVQRYAVPAVDAAGRVYVTRSQNGARSLAIYEAGKLVKEGLDIEQGLVPAPSAGSYVAVGINELSLHAPDGTQRWAAPQPNRAHPIWVDDDHLVANVWPGISAIDVATGAAGRTRCGWKLGLSATPNPPPAATATACTRLADARADRVEAPGDAAFQSAMREIASSSAGAIAEWGIAPINGTNRRFAVIVANPENLMDSISGYIVEVAPGQYVGAIFGGWGIVQPNYAGVLSGDPAWTVGAAAAAAREDRYGNPLAKYRDGGFSFEKRWIHMSGEEFHFTVRANTFVVADWNWVERERDNTGMHSTGEHKNYSTTGTCGTRCPKLEGHKSHSTKLKVVGPTSDLAALTVAGEPSWTP